jgi:tetraacyldisaccharide 4'-kinase
MQSILLSPLASLYGAVAGARLLRSGTRVGVPVVCIGNPTVGGAGKTPLAITVARLFATAGMHPVFLTRGYGGSLAGPLLVDPKKHRSEQVGDEPLLLARIAPAVVGRDRVAGASLAISAGASVIVMDDGFQNPSLQKDVSILVVDARRQIGNGQVLPAGPLRAPLGAQLARADALVIVGSGGSPALEAAARRAGVAVFGARLAADAAALSALREKRLLAFAGIGDPEKFFATLRNASLLVVRTRAFADHHRYSPSETAALCRAAEREELTLVTTEKDWARLPDEGPSAELKMRTKVLPVTLTFADQPAFCAFLWDRIAQSRRS